MWGAIFTAAVCGSSIQWKQNAGRRRGGRQSKLVKHAGFEAKVTAAAFVAADHKIAKDKEGATLVDGIRIWGTDGGVPRRTLSLAVTFDGKAIRIPAEAVRDLFEPGMDTLVLLSPAKPAGQAVVLMMNSDGAGAYCVAWAFSGGTYRGRTVFVLGSEVCRTLARCGTSARLPLAPAAISATGRVFCHGGAPVSTSDRRRGQHAGDESLAPLSIRFKTNKSKLQRVGPRCLIDSDVRGGMSDTAAGATPSGWLCRGASAQGVRFNRTTGPGDFAAESSRP